MIHVQPFTDSTPLLDDPEALRARWAEDGCLFLRGVIDADLVDWAHGKFRGVLAESGLIDPAVEAPLWTGEEPKEWRTCNALGTEVWPKFTALPKLNTIMRDVFDCEPVWTPIANHRSGMPSGPVAEGQDLFVGRHQDGFFSEGMEFAICWMPMRDIAMDKGSFAAAPGWHKGGNLHVPKGDGYSIPTDAIPADAWRAAEFKVGDLLILHAFVPHATLPNPSNEIRTSLDLRVIPAYAPQPVSGTVAEVDGLDVTIQTDEGARVTVHVDDDTFIRDMNPRPRIPTAELDRVAYPGARVLAMAKADGNATVMRRNAY